jgi:hypothetical protein
MVAGGSDESADALVSVAAVAGAARLTPSDEQAATDSALTATATGKTARLTMA